MADEVENTAPETPAESFTPAEREYFDSRGEKALEPAKEPTVEEAKPPETSAEEPAKEPAKTEEKRMVDYGALAEERAKRKAAEEKARELEILKARWEERFAAAQKPPEEPGAPPSPDEDIFGAVKHDRAEIQRTRQEIEAFKAQQAQQQQLQQMGQWAASMEAEFKKTNPDYADAFNHLRDARAQELRDGWGMNEAQIEQQLTQEWRQITFRAAQEKSNPAERVYALAKVRGYQKKAPQSEDESKKLDVIEAGMQSSKSLSSVGGKSGGGQELTAMDILKMPADEFDAWKNKNPAKFRRIMGATH